MTDGGVTHNFIDATLVARRPMDIEDFKGFNTVVADGFNMTCTQKIPRLAVTLGNYNLNDDFYVVDLADINIVLGVQWLHSLGELAMNYQAMEMRFNIANGKKIVLRGMSNGGPKIVSTKRMEAIFRHRDITCVE